MKKARVKIIGAGSIGNHLAQASRRMGWDVTVVDTDGTALRRMKEEIYPMRYGSWDDRIVLTTPDKAPRGRFDVIMIGTPPHVRMKLALQALKEKPKVLQLEKPLCAPFDRNLRKFVKAYHAQKSTVVVVGYDHAVARSIARVAGLLKKGVLGKVITLDVEFREHWQGIFKAHPWLSGPADTYLGYWKRGGGASGEHSHALHLWQYLAKVSGFGVPKKVSSALKVEKVGRAEYDSIASFTIETDKKNIGRVIQDVVTHPTRKWARVQGEKGFIEWICVGHPTGDVIRYSRNGDVKEEIFEKKRPDDFYAEVLHIHDILNRKVKEKDSPLFLAGALTVMSVLETAWISQAESLTTILPIK